MGFSSHKTESKCGDIDDPHLDNFNISHRSVCVCVCVRTRFRARVDLLVCVFSHS